MFEKFIAVFSFFVFSTLFANSKTFCLDVEISDIVFRNDGIFLLVENVPIQVNSLEHKDGIYRAKISRGIGDVLGIWFCPQCDKMNSKFENVCARCGYVKPS